MTNYDRITKIVINYFYPDYTELKMSWKLFFITIIYHCFHTKKKNYIVKVFVVENINWLNFKKVFLINLH